MENGDIENLSPADFLRRQAEDKDWQLLDVREAWEIEIAAIDGSVRIPMSDIAARRHELAVDKPLAVLCHSGVRSQRAAEYLRSTGFMNVANIDGGIDAWAVHVDTALARY